MAAIGVCFALFSGPCLAALAGLPKARKQLNGRSRAAVGSPLLLAAAPSRKQLTAPPNR